MTPSPLRSALAALCALAAATPAAEAQSGPGLPDLVYDPSELFTWISSIGAGSHGQALLHDGYLTVFRYSDGAIDFYDLSNPYAPDLVKTFNVGTMSETHTAVQTTAYGGQHLVFARGPGGLGGTGIGIWDLTDVFAPVFESAFDLPGVPGGYATGVFWVTYQAPYAYVGAGSLGLFVVDASDPTAPFVARQLPTSATGGFNAVNTLAVGNTLVVTNSDGGPGMARLDISDPVDPQLLSSTTNTSIPYGLNLNGGRLLVPAVTAPVSDPTSDGLFEIRDLFQPSFPVINSIPLLARGGSAIVQEDFAHVGASFGYEKLDVGDDAAWAQVGSALKTDPAGDWDWVTPMGNLAVVADDQGFATFIVPHDAVPDNVGPTVTMVDPPDGAVNQALTTRVGITTSDMVELASLDPSTFTVRLVGGPPLDGSYSHQFGIVNFTPRVPLLPNRTYEVVVTAGGLRDWSGNPTPATFTSRFSTGGTVTAIDVTVQPSPPVALGLPVSVDVAAVTGPGPFQYSWDFGDGTPATPFSPQSQASHVYADAGHYSVLVTVQGGEISGTDSFLQTVHHPLTALRPTRSGTIVLDEARSRAWCVNPDQDTVTAIGTDTYQKLLEVPVGARPRTVALAPDGAVWVVCEEDAGVWVLNPVSGAPLATIALPPGSAPHGVAMSPDGGTAWVSLGGTGGVARLDPVARVLLGTTPVGPDPRGVAVSADSQRVFVTRFRSATPPTPVPGAATTGGGAAWLPVPRPREPVAEVYELAGATGAVVGARTLALDGGPDTDASGRGLPNYLSSATVSPDGRRLWVPSKKDNIERGLFRDGLPLTFESTVRTIVSQIALDTDQEVPLDRIDFNNRDLASAVELSPLGDWAFVALQGSNAIEVRDAYTGAVVAAVEGSGLAPQGLVLTSDGARLFVHNFMSRTVSVHDVSGVTAAQSFAIPLLAGISTVANEALSPQVLLGKQIFYDASDPRMSRDGYLSCASCHLDGGHDGRTWDFTDRGEGLRNTTSLLGRAGTGHGNVHWTANFDEIQDFENDIRGSFGGAGFLDDALFAGPANDPLGAPKAGLSVPLDALAAYVSSLQAVGESPHRAPDGSLTPSAANGRVHFAQLGCGQCHAGAAFTDSATGALHDVGTIQASSGQAIGGPLTGLDTPTLRGSWATAPYLHDGSAATLLDVLTTRNPAGQHGATGTLTAAQLQELVDYLLQIDDLEPAAP